MLTSDFIDSGNKQTKTFVELDFVCGKNKYSIKRIIKKSTKEAHLTLPDGTAISGDRNVKAKIIEIIGLDQEQFAQIVMIAQNDFLRFLQSGTEDRLKILRRIFGTESLRQLQDQLKDLYREENHKRAFILQEFDRYNVDVYNRGEVFREWDLQIKTDRQEFSEIEIQLEKYDKLKQTLAAEHAEALELAKKMASLAKFQHEFEVHKGKINEIAELKNQMLLGETALRKIKPHWDELKKAEANHKTAALDLAKAKKQGLAAKAELEASEKAICPLPPLEDCQKEYAGILKEWELAETSLIKMSALQKDYITITDKEKVLLKWQAEFEKLNIDFINTDSKYRAFEESFLRGQAGVLAAGLTSGNPCPVCGSREHPTPAELIHENITEAQLKKAKEVVDKTRQKRETKSAECASLQSEIDTLTKGFLRDFTGLVIPMNEKENDTNITDLTLKDYGTLLNKQVSDIQNKVRNLSLRKDTEKNNLKNLTNIWNISLERKAKAESSIASAQTLINERAANEQRMLSLQDASLLAYNDALSVNGFYGEPEYMAALISEKELTELNKQITEYEKNDEQLTRDISRLKNEIGTKTGSEIESIKTKLDDAITQVKVLNEKRDEINKRLSKLTEALEKLTIASVKLENAESICANLKQLAETASGKLDFETYVQMAYFECVIHNANLRLQIMSQNRYTLLRKTDSTNPRRKRFGLELAVLDAYTGKSRSANSLSGGESFITALALALGLSDVVQQNAGGIRLDTMFIDEGFGSLDTDALELAIRTLSDMAKTDRIIGIISHVTELQERIDKQVHVRKTPTGSIISVF